MEVGVQTDGKVPVNSKTWLITGASSGLGFALAQYVLEQGDCAVLGARNLRPMSELVAHYPDTGLALTLDVTRHEDRAAAIVQAEGRFGGIDVLVNNAGIEFLRRTTLNRKKAAEKRPIAAQCKTKILGRDTVAAIPLTFKFRPFIRKHFRQALHRPRDQTVSLLHRPARLIHEAALDGVPASAKFLRLFGRKEGRRLFVRG